MDASQLLNKVLGRNQETGVEFWRQPERSGWLMKQGAYHCTLPRSGHGKGTEESGIPPRVFLTLLPSRYYPAGEFMKTWRRR